VPISPEAKEDATRSLQRSSGSFELVLAPVITALLGLWLDRTIGTVPLFTVMFSVFGFAGAAISVYYQYNHRMDRLRAESPWRNRS
jgi:F0F1-type ATP synthase assembly protein I